MNAKSGKLYLTLALLGLSLAATLSIGLGAQHSGATLQATAQAEVATMQLQGYEPSEEGSAAPHAAEGDKAALCAHRDAQCAPQKQDIVLVLADDRPTHESKAFAAPGDEVPLKFKH